MPCSEMKLCLSQPTAQGRAQMCSTYPVVATTGCCCWGEQEGLSQGFSLGCSSQCFLCTHLGHMQLYALFTDIVSSTQKRFNSCLTPALHQYFWPEINFFQWQKCLSQLCFLLLLHPIAKAWLLILLSMAPLADPIQSFILPLKEQDQRADQG